MSVSETGAQAAGRAWVVAIVVILLAAWAWWSPLARLTLAGIPVVDTGSGSALFNTTAQLSASIGVTLLFRATSTTLSANPVASRAAARSGAFGDALTISLGAGIVLLAIALATSWLLPRRDPTPTAPPELSHAASPSRHEGVTSS